MQLRNIKTFECQVLFRISNDRKSSGGNQQKLMLAKLLAMKPKVLFLDEPTRGIDVGAKAEIHQLLRRLSNEGISVVVISSEMPETIGVCDRVVVVNVGKVVENFQGRN